jgi:hypothetical protein
MHALQMFGAAQTNIAQTNVSTVRQFGIVWTNIRFAHTDNVFEPPKNSTIFSRRVIQVLLRSHSENKLEFVTCRMIHKRTLCSLRYDPLH